MVDFMATTHIFCQPFLFPRRSLIHSCETSGCVLLWPELSPRTKTQCICSSWLQVTSLRMLSNLHKGEKLSCSTKGCLEPLPLSTLQSKEPVAWRPHRKELKSHSLPQNCQLAKELNGRAKMSKKEVESKPKSRSGPLSTEFEHLEFIWINTALYLHRGPPLIQTEQVWKQLTIFFSNVLCFGREVP